MQAASSTVRICRLSLNTREEHLTSRHGKHRPFFNVEWVDREARMSMDYSQCSQLYHSAAELFMAVREHGAARGVEVTLDEDESCVVLHRM